MARVVSAGLPILAAVSVSLAVWRAQREGATLFPPLRLLSEQTAWLSSRVAATGAEIRSHLPSGRVLTLAPTWPLAGGLEIYPEFATGPFAWRSARFVSPERRPKIHLIAPADLPALLAARPPDGILTGLEDEDLEAPLIRYAQEHHFHVVKLAKKRELWLPPAPAAPD